MTDANLKVDMVMTLNPNTAIYLKDIDGLYRAMVTDSLGHTLFDQGHYPSLYSAIQHSISINNKIGNNNV
jgi:hypothetical protein